MHYEYYFGDGYSKGFDQIDASKPYGEGFEIAKIKCLGKTLHKEKNCETIRDLDDLLMRV